MKDVPEQVIQQECYIWFNNTYCLKKHNPRLLIHSVPNGVAIELHPKDKTRVLDLLLKTGMVPGISDLIIHGVNGRCIMPECKKLTGKQSPEQIEIQSRIESLGGIYFVFRSLLEFQLEISKHINWLLGKE